MSRSPLDAVVRDNAGNILVGAKVFVYENGTTTAVTDFFPSSAGGVAQSSFISNGSGRIRPWATTPRLVRLRVTDNAGAATYSNGDPAPFSEFDIDDVPIYENPLDQQSGDLLVGVDPRTFGGSWDGVGDDYAALMAAIASISRGTILLPAHVLLSATVVVPEAISVRGLGGSADYVNGSDAPWAPATEVTWSGGAAPVFRIAGPSGGITIDRMGIDGDNVATVAVDMDMAQGCHVDVDVRQCVTTAVDMRVSGGTADVGCQHNTVRVSAARCPSILRLDGNAGHNANCCHNSFPKIMGIFTGAAGIDLGNCDNNSFGSVFLYRQSGVGKGVHFGSRARANYFWHLEASAGGVSVDVPNDVNRTNVIANYDQENGQPDPVIAAGATLEWGSSGVGNAGGLHHQAITVGYKLYMVKGDGSLMEALHYDTGSDILDLLGAKLRVLSSGDALLANTKYFLGRNAANNANISLIRVNASDNIEIGPSNAFTVFPGGGALLQNNKVLQGRNAANNANLDLIKVDATDIVQIYGGVLRVLSSGEALLQNNKYYLGRNAGDSANVNLIRVNASDNIEIGPSNALLVFPSGGTLVQNNRAYQGRDAGNANNIDLVKLDASDRVVVGASGKALLLHAATTAVASLNIPPGTAPTSPVDGDIWTTSAGLYVQIAGATVGPLS